MCYTEHSSARLHTALCSLQLMGRHITSHRRHPNTSYTSHHSSAVTKQHDHIKTEGREESGREHVWVEENDAWKIKGCRQSKACAWLCSHNFPPNPPLFLPGSREEPKSVLMTCEFRPCWINAALDLNLFTSVCSKSTRNACWKYLNLNVVV